jgi:hypothetical protein
VPEPGHAVLIGYLAVQYLCLCKLFDGIARIAAGRELEPVPFTPVSIISPFLPLKYNIGLLLLGLALLPVALPLIYAKYPLVHEMAGYLLFISIWLFVTAALLNLVRDNSILSMINPGEWIATIRAIGIGKYATILLVQAALLFAANYLLQYLPLDHLNAKATIILTDLCNTTAFSLIYLYPHLLPAAARATTTNHPLTRPLP